MCHDHECRWRWHVSVGLVLLKRGRERDVKENDPGHANLGPHLEIKLADAGVERSAHEDVVHEVTGHAVLSTRDDGNNVRDQGDSHTKDDGHGHDGTKVVNDVRKTEKTSVVKGKREGQGCVPRIEAIAEVAKLERERKEVWKICQESPRDTIMKISHASTSRLALLSDNATQAHAIHTSRVDKDAVIRRVKIIIMPLNVAQFKNESRYAYPLTIQRRDW